MRPAVHASILRNRGPKRQSRRKMHVFSTKCVLLMVLFGLVLIIPGLALTIVGVVKTERYRYDLQDDVQKIVYQAVGPFMCAVGAIIMFGSCIYFNCYGSHSSQTSSPPSKSQDRDGKGSIRSSRPREGSQQIQQSQNNGRAVDVHSSENDCTRSLTGDQVTGPKSKGPNANWTSGASDEVPLASMEEEVETSKGQ